MPLAMEVRPEKWSQIRVLFDNGTYSVIAGVYDGDRERLGERWNGAADAPLGFPNVAGNAVWHVVPPFLEIPILHGLIDELARNPRGQVGNNQPEVVVRELRNRHAAAARSAGA